MASPPNPTQQAPFPLPPPGYAPPLTREEQVRPTRKGLHVLRQGISWMVAYNLAGIMAGLLLAGAMGAFGTTARMNEFLGIFAAWVVAGIAVLIGFIGVLRSLLGVARLGRAPRAFGAPYARDVNRAASWLGLAAISNMGLMVAAAIQGASAGLTSFAGVSTPLMAAGFGPRTQAVAVGLVALAATATAAIGMRFLLARLLTYDGRRLTRLFYWLSVSGALVNLAAIGYFAGTGQIPDPSGGPSGLVSYRDARLMLEFGVLGAGLGTGALVLYRRMIADALVGIDNMERSGTRDPDNEPLPLPAPPPTRPAAPAPVGERKLPPL